MTARTSARSPWPRAGSLPGIWGGLTSVVPSELLDAALAETRSVQRRLRDLPSRKGVYFLLAMCPFPRVGYRLGWDKLTAGLSEMPVIVCRRRRCVTCRGGSAARQFERCSRCWPGRRRQECVSAPVPDGVAQRLQFAVSP
ncbi:transposase domain-containing protein [Streptomyces sp. NPDC087901]|uniref:transposase domain-containing protein n=1 Tax=Streptomyces sp. NPDC087901 TaxID=3365818 RepID=UPI003800A261